jgi:excisionase family DNA binding protein
MGSTLPDKAYFRVDELADYWRVSEKTIRRWIKGGSLNAIKLNGSIRVPKEAVIRFERRTGRDMS